MLDSNLRLPDGIFQPLTSVTSLCVRDVADLIVGCCWLTRLVLRPTSHVHRRCWFPNMVHIGAQVLPSHYTYHPCVRGLPAARGPRASAMLRAPPPHTHTSQDTELIMPRCPHRNFYSAKLQSVDVDAFVGASITGLYVALLRRGRFPLCSQ